MTASCMHTGNCLHVSNALNHASLPPTDIKRLNNIITDSTVACRTHLYVPAFAAPGDISGCTLTYEYDEHSQRGFAVALRPGEDDGVRAGGGARESEPQDGRDDAPQKAKVAALLARALRIDEATAAYYLEVSNLKVFPFADGREVTDIFRQTIPSHFVPREDEDDESVSSRLYQTLSLVNTT
jgi:hypothetical protein